MFKLVCGAGNEDAESVRRLVYVYAKAGCRFFDLSARNEVLDAAKQGVKLADVDDVLFCVSIGIKGDKHIKKAKIDYSKCSKCLKCTYICPNSAITPDLSVFEKKCIGCGICLNNCSDNAIIMYEKDINYKKVLPDMLNNGVKIIELHVMGHDKKDLINKWQFINECSPQYASICIDREYFGNKEIIEQITEMISQRKPYTTIIQADGVPMSGGNDDFKTTLQAVAMAEVIQNAKLPVHIMLSGGTNSKTAELARMCGIKYWGIAVGSWARKIVKDYIEIESFWENDKNQKEAINLAKNLILKCN